MVVLAIDPGNEKCGVAIVAGGSVSLQEVLERQGYAAFLQNVTKKYDIDHVVIGDGTRSSDFLRETIGPLVGVVCFPRVCRFHLSLMMIMWR